MAVYDSPLIVLEKMGASGVRGAAWSEWRRETEREDEKQKHVDF